MPTIYSIMAAARVAHPEDSAKAYAATLGIIDTLETLNERAMRNKLDTAARVALGRAQIGIDTRAAIYDLQAALVEAQSRKSAAAIENVTRLMGNVRDNFTKLSIADFAYTNAIIQKAEDDAKNAPSIDADEAFWRAFAGSAWKDPLFTGGNVNTAHTWQNAISRHGDPYQFFKPTDTTFAQLKQLEETAKMSIEQRGDAAVLSKTLEAQTKEWIAAYDSEDPARIEAITADVNATVQTLGKPFEGLDQADVDARTADMVSQDELIEHRSEALKSFYKSLGVDSGGGGSRARSMAKLMGAPTFRTWAEAKGFNIGDGSFNPNDLADFTYRPGKDDIRALLRYEKARRLGPDSPRTRIPTDRWIQVEWPTVKPEGLALQDSEGRFFYVDEPVAEGDAGPPVRRYLKPADAAAMAAGEQPQVLSGTWTSESPGEDGQSTVQMFLKVAAGVDAKGQPVWRYYEFRRPGPDTLPTEPLIAEAAKNEVPGTTSFKPMVTSEGGQPRYAKVDEVIVQAAGGSPMLASGVLEGDVGPAEQTEEAAVEGRKTGVKSTTEVPEEFRGPSQTVYGREYVSPYGVGISTDGGGRLLTVAEREAAKVVYEEKKTSRRDAREQIRGAEEAAFAKEAAAGQEPTPGLEATSDIAPADEAFGMDAATERAAVKSTDAGGYVRPSKEERRQMADERVASKKAATAAAVDSRLEARGIEPAPGLPAKKELPLVLAELRAEMAQKEPSTNWTDEMLLTILKARASARPGPAGREGDDSEWAPGSKPSTKLQEPAALPAASSFMELPPSATPGMSSQAAVQAYERGREKTPPADAPKARKRPPSPTPNLSATKANIEASSQWAKEDHARLAALDEALPDKPVLDMTVSADNEAKRQKLIRAAQMQEDLKAARERNATIRELP